MTTIETPRLLTVREVARILRLGRSTVYRLAAEHDLPTIKVGGSLRIDSDQLTRWLYGHHGEDRDAA